MECVRASNRGQTQRLLCVIHILDKIHLSVWKEMVKKSIWFRQHVVGTEENVLCNRMTITHQNSLGNEICAYTTTVGMEKISVEFGQLSKDDRDGQKKKRRYREIRVL